MDLSICLLYNINIINLNRLIEEKIWIEIDNFLFDNNLKNLPENSKDRKKIYNHFIASNLLEVLNQNYNNIFIYNKNYNTSSFVISKNIIDIVKVFKLNLFDVDLDINNTELLIDRNIIYQFKCLAENKKKINFKKIQDFCDKNSLVFLSDKIKNNLKTKMLLHK